VCREVWSATFVVDPRGGLMAQPPYRQDPRIAAAQMIQEA
jgi:hypothetical protein